MSNSRYCLFHDSGQTICNRVHSAVTKDNVAIALLGEDTVRPWDVSEGFVTCVDKKPQLSDRLWSYSGELMLSQKAHNLITNLAIAQCITVVPVTLLSKKKETFGKYYVYYSRDKHDVLDTARSEYEMMRTVEQILLVKKWVLDRKKIPTADIFYAGYQEWIVSERFVRTFQENKVTGCTFIEAEVAEG